MKQLILRIDKAGVEELSQWLILLEKTDQLITDSDACQKLAALIVTACNRNWKELDYLTYADLENGIRLESEDGKRCQVKLKKKSKQGKTK